MLQVGLSQELTFSVTPELSAKAVGSGTLEVLATPIMIARMEQAAWTAAAPHLDPGSATVGTLMNVQHLSPSPLGMSVTCRAELIETDGRRLVFRVTAWDAAGTVGEGVHERAVIQNERFMDKARKKLKTVL